MGKVVGGMHDRKGKVVGGMHDELGIRPASW